MRLSRASLSKSLLTIASLLSAAALAESNLTAQLSSKIILPATFTPPQVFENVNLLRTINLDKSYPRVTTNVIIENVSQKPQTTYYIPFEAGVIDKVAALEVKDKRDAAQSSFKTELVEYDLESSTQFYAVTLNQPLKPSEQLTISVSYALIKSLAPLPDKIKQTDMQFLVHTFSAYSPSSYKTLKQKTKLKFPTGDVPEYTVLPAKNSEGKDDPQKQGSALTYGPYGEVPAGAVEPVQVRYEYTKPVTHMSLYERDVEVSHWGGNLATEERYWLENHAASLKEQFSRLSWTTTSYYNPPTTALKALHMQLRVGSTDPYFIDDIGNVSTSRFRSNRREASLELKPRYPVFGGWKYSYKVGWDSSLSHFLRKVSTSLAGDRYVLRLPFIEGPAVKEGIQYANVKLRIILPEGATDVTYETSVPIVSSEVTLHKTFLDTLGRTALNINAINLVDDQRDRTITVSYTYSLASLLRKPIAITAAALSLFVGTYLLSKVDVRIGAKR